MNSVEIITAKRDGKELTDEEIRWFLDSYTNGSIPDEQTSALLMAILFQGLNPRELSTWTKAMIDSGERLDLTSLSAPSVDKHSTGGVGDKVSLILVPLVSACGAAVPQLSGRGLGHTGGTLDKLESIPGFQTDMENDKIISQLRDMGGVICAASSNLAPADKKLYALRDVTGTVESIPLIASSIMSKKIAEGTSSLVLDVKVGSGAFMKELSKARELAETMVELGENNGVRCSALLTNMDTPLGKTAGNALEVEETLEALAGGGPSDLREITLALAREMLDLANMDTDPEKVLDSGKAMDKWREMIQTQGGDPDAPLPKAPEVAQITAAEAGSSQKCCISKMDAMAVGLAAWRLGAGRGKKDDPVSAAAGVRLLHKPGEEVGPESVLAELHTEKPETLDSAKEVFLSGMEFAPSPPPPEKLVLDTVRKENR